MVIFNDEDGDFMPYEQLKSLKSLFCESMLVTMVMFFAWNN